MTPRVRCTERVQAFGGHFQRCYRTATLDGFCKQHHPASVRERAKKGAARYEANRQRDIALYVGLATDEQLRAELARREAKGGEATAQQHTDVDGGAGADAPAPLSLEAQ